WHAEASRRSDPELLQPARGTKDEPSAGESRDDSRPRRLPGRERRLRAGAREVSRWGREQPRARADDGQRQEGLLRVSPEEIRQQAPARSRRFLQSETAQDAVPAAGRADDTPAIRACE